MNGGAPELGGPFGRGKSPADQRTSGHSSAKDKGIVGGAMAAAGYTIFAIEGATATAVVLGFSGVMVIGMGIGQMVLGGAGGGTEPIPKDGGVDTSTNSGGGVPKDEGDAGGEATEGVPVVTEPEPEDPNKKPDPNASRPDPNAYYPAPDDGDGGPNSRAAGFPNSFDTFPAPDGESGVGPRAAGVELRSLGVALGKGLESTIRVMGPQSFRVAY